MVGEEEGMVEEISMKEVVSLVPEVGEDSDSVEGQRFRQLWSITPIIMSPIRSLTLLSRPL